MAWSASAWFRAFFTDTALQATGTGWAGIDADSIKAALYQDTITPDKDATSAASAYGGGVWATTAPTQQFEAGQWAQGGEVLASKTFTNPSTGVVMLDAADRASANAADLLNVAGVYVYDDTVSASPSKPGITFNYFGSNTNSVTNGTFTVVWHANGIGRVTV